MVLWTIRGIDDLPKASNANEPAFGPKIGGEMRDAGNFHGEDGPAVKFAAGTKRGAETENCTASNQ